MTAEFSQLSRAWFLFMDTGEPVAVTETMAAAMAAIIVNTRRPMCVVPIAPFVVVGPIELEGRADG